MRVHYPLQVFIIDWLLKFVNQTQVGADLRYLFAVMRHICPGYAHCVHKYIRNVQRKASVHWHLAAAI